MLHDLEVSQSIEVNKSIDKVWHALTTPEIIKEYLFGTETLTDWKVGSEVVFQGEYEGHKYRDHGVILENIPNKKIRYSYWSGFSGTEDKPENYSSVMYSLESLGPDKTKFTWTQKGYANEKAYEHSKGNMPGFLQKVKEVMEK